MHIISIIRNKILLISRVLIGIVNATLAYTNNNVIMIQVLVGISFGIVFLQLMLFNTFTAHVCIVNIDV